MKNSFYLLLLIVVFSIAGCATSQDLKSARSELNEKLSAVDAELTTLKKEQEKSSSTVASMSKGHANSAADLSDLRETIQQLRGQLETLKKDMARDAKKSDELKEKLDSIALKVNFIESFLEIGKKDSVGDDKVTKPAGNGVGAKEAGKKQDKETLYAAAYQTFKDSHYDKSRTEFKNFLATYPDTEYAGNAQYWIGECYYFEKNYEQAILEYEKVSKNYPKGNKVSSALLKQGLSFLKLNDKTSAKLILQQVIKDFPNTTQARIARSKLQEIK
ncbi:MAG: tol-pal system protein YbgF [Deltaproteobacteria bacterium]